MLFLIQVNQTQSGIYSNSLTMQNIFHKYADLHTSSKKLITPRCNMENVSGHSKTIVCSTNGDDPDNKNEGEEEANEQLKTFIANY